MNLALITAIASIVGVGGLGGVMLSWRASLIRDRVACERRCRVLSKKYERVATILRIKFGVTAEELAPMSLRPDEDTSRIELDDETEELLAMASEPTRNERGRKRR